MKSKLILLPGLCMAFFFGMAQNNPSHNKAIDKVNRTINSAGKTVNKGRQVIAVFQPYLLKARQLFFDAKQLTGEVKQNAKNQFSKTENASGENQNNNNTSQSIPDFSSTSGTNQNSSNQMPSGNTFDNNGFSNSPQNYLPDQTLPVNNTSTINNDGSGNWGNQNSGLYGNCLDVMTGTVMGMGEAAQSPQSVDLMFFAPDDGQNTYYLMTPGFARNNGTATYMTGHTSDQVAKWNDVNESEVALTRLTIGQFNQVQNNNQIQSAVLNAQNYSGNYASVGQKLEGKVFAVKVQMDNREVYALVAVLKHFGTSGSNGYLKIQIKTTGLANKDGQIQVQSYLR